MSRVLPIHARLFVGGVWVDGDARALEVLDKYTGALIGSVECAGHEQVDAAVSGARLSFDRSRLSPDQRYQILQSAARLVELHGQELATLITAEAGLPISDATTEVGRAVQTLLTCAEEAKRLVGEMVPIEAAPGQAHRMAFTIRVPRGVVCGITAFNSPLNMVCHKIGPALAAGNTVVIKPPELAPLTATRFVELLLEAGCPVGHVNLVHGRGEDVGPWLVDNQDINFYTFTGSTRVGTWLHSRVGLRPVALELGSISATIVCDDADLDRAAVRCAASGFRRAGQMCTSIQRLFVDARVVEGFTTRMVDAAKRLTVGDPRDRATDVGPMISEAEAVRAESWIVEAADAGARILHGGSRDGALLTPTILTNVTPAMRLMRDEVFAPVLSIVPFDSIDDMVRQVNATPLGLAAGIFTRDVTRAFTLAQRLHVGLVHINETSSSRVDLIPFGGVKQSGIGREGPRYAMREMTEERLITISLTQEIP